MFKLYFLLLCSGCATVASAAYGIQEIIDNKGMHIGIILCGIFLGICAWLVRRITKENKEI